MTVERVLTTRHAPCSNGQVTETRTYALYDIEWERGSRWTGYHTLEEAQATLDGSRSAGRATARVFTADVADRHAHLYKPGISEAEIVRALALPRSKEA